MPQAFTTCVRWARRASTREVRSIVTATSAPSSALKMGPPGAPLEQWVFLAVSGSHRRQAAQPHCRPKAPVQALLPGPTPPASQKFLDAARAGNCTARGPTRWRPLDTWHALDAWHSFNAYRVCVGNGLAVTVPA